MNEFVYSIIAVSGLILLLIVGVILTFFISSHRKRKQEIILAETKANFQLELRTVETEVREGMMEQFAQELHDNIGQLLTAMHLQLETQKLDHPDLKEGLKPIEIYVSEVRQQVRLLSKTLNNDFVARAGLIESFKTELERIEALKQYKVHSNINFKASIFTADEELLIFRIFQEIVQNVLKHADGENFYFDLTMDKSNFHLQVRDDGVGFDFEKEFNNKEGSGLFNIQKRTSLVGVKTDISSILTEGTTIILRKSLSSSYGS